jgi:uncharacterized protein (TIGR03067 family)
MKPLALMVVTGTLLMGGCKPSAREPETKARPTAPASPIEGKWVVVSCEVEGVPSHETANHYRRMTFAGEDASLQGRTETHELHFTLDTTQQPKEINLYSKQEKVRWKGIYQLDGKTLRLSYGQPNGERPSRLDTSEGDKAILYVLKREE